MFELTHRYYFPDDTKAIFRSPVQCANSAPLGASCRLLQEAARKEFPACRDEALPERATMRSKHSMSPSTADVAGKLKSEGPCRTEVWRGGKPSTARQQPEG